ncbi:hypothetical protein, partial [Nocardioides abyssi]
MFCYNLVQFLLQPSAFFATTGEAPSWTTSYFCYNRFVVCCKPVSIFATTDFFDFSGTSAQFFIFATT